MTGRPFKAACIQMTSGADVAANIEAASALIREAAGAGAQLIATPEVTHLMVLKAKELFAKTKPQAEDPGVHAFAALAEELKRWLLIGSLAIRISDDKVANRSFLFAPDGSIAASYDKMHMFDVDLPSGEVYRESANYQAGTARAIAGLPWGHLGLTICYDLRFPYLYRELAKDGADFLSVPSAFTQQTGEAHWHILMRARAIETGCFVIAPAQTGDHECGRQTFGHSLIVDPWGTVLSDGGTDVGVSYAEIDPAKVGEARARIPSLNAAPPFH